MTVKNRKSLIDIQLSIRCLAFKSDEFDAAWCAVGLESNVWGFGNTREEAMKDLYDLIDIKIEFAVGKDAIHTLNHPADTKWFDLWDKLQNQEIADYTSMINTFNAQLDENKYPALVA